MGKETNFEFKYVPEFYTRTEKGESESAMVKPRGGGVERRNLITFIFASVAIGVGSWFGLSAVRGIGGIMSHSFGRVGF